MRRNPAYLLLNIEVLLFFPLQSLHKPVAFASLLLQLQSQ